MIDRDGRADRHAPRRRRAPGGAQPPAARRRRAWRGPAAHPRGRGLGEDPGAHPPHRPPGAHRRRRGGRDPGHHLHQQGRAGDARARRAAGGPAHPRDVAHDLPRGLHADAARRGPAPGLHPPVHDLRPGRRAPARQAVPRRPGRGHQALHAQRGPAPDLRRQEQAARRRDLPGHGRRLLRDDRRRRLPALRARAAAHERDGLRRPPRPRGQRPRALPGGPRSLRPRPSATCSWTSTRTPTTPSTAGSSS